MQLLTIIELQERLKVGPSKFEALAYAVDLPVQDVYDEDEVKLIEEAYALDQDTKPRPVKKGAIARNQPSKPVAGNIQKTEAITTSRHQQGQVLGQQAAFAELKGFTDVYTGITTEFYDRFSQMTESQIQSTQGIEVDGSPLDYGSMVDSFFDEEAQLLQSVPE